MSIISVDDLPYADGCLVFMLTGLICAVVRWMHMCRPYDEEGKYFYPARKQATFFFAAVVMQFPYYLCPSDEGAWAYVKMFGILYYPVCFSMLFLRYFQGRGLQGLKNHLFFGIPMLLLTAMLVAVLFENVWFEQQLAWLVYVEGGFSILLTTRLFQITGWMKKAIDKYHKDNYATETDFPYRFAKKVIGLPFIWIVLMWILFVVGNRDFKLVLDLLLSCWMVFFLCAILHPQRALRSSNAARKMQDIAKEEREIAEEEMERNESEEALEYDPSDKSQALYSEEVKKQVIAVILRRYRESHLLKTEVLADIDKGMIAPASRFIASVGYYRLINMFRLRHAELYAKAHPGAKQFEVAKASGYLSDQALCRARKNVDFIDEELVQDVHL